MTGTNVCFLSRIGERIFRDAPSFRCVIGLSTPDKLSQLGRPAGGVLSTTKMVQDFIPCNCKAITDKLAPVCAQDSFKFKISFAQDLRE